jgi:ribosome-associated toxin RatA of RatAB toxin-antitoxin module
MRFIKLGLISVVMIFLLFTGMSLFIPSNVNISRAINLSAKPDSILQLIRDTTKWAQWYPGFDTLQSQGTAILFQPSENNKVSVEFIKGDSRPITSTWQVIPYTNTDSITVQWYMHFKLRWYPWEKFGSLLYDGAYGQQMERGLNNIKMLTSQ